MQALKQRMADIRASEADKPKARAQRRRPSIVSHRAFIPMLTAWGAALGAGSVMVLPRAMIMQAAMATGLAGLGSFARYGQAFIAAVVLGGLALAVAAAIRHRRAAVDASDPDAAMLADTVRPIDPVLELGSESLDAPIDERGFDESAVSEPREMGLEEFGALPGRDAVWVAQEDIDGGAQSEAPPQTLDPAEADTASAAGHAPEAAAAALATKQDNDAPDPALSAIAKLRSVPPGDLSLVQMIERFAAALHERQAAEQRNPGKSRSPGRDTALADALRALSVLSEAGYGSIAGIDGEEADHLHDTTRELREALGKLQCMSGAA